MSTLEVTTAHLSDTPSATLHSRFKCVLAVLTSAMETRVRPTASLIMAGLTRAIGMGTRYAATATTGQAVIKVLNLND